MFEDISKSVEGLLGVIEQGVNVFGKTAEEIKDIIKKAGEVTKPSYAEAPTAAKPAQAATATSATPWTTLLIVGGGLLAIMIIAGRR